MDSEAGVGDEPCGRYVTLTAFPSRVSAMAVEPYSPPRESPEFWVVPGALAPVPEPAMVSSKVEAFS